MTHSFRPILHKTRVHGLRLDVRRSGLCLNDPVLIFPQEDGRLALFAVVEKMFLGLLPRRRHLALGHLGPHAERLLQPWLATPSPLRLRIVSLTPEHLAGDGPPEVHVSVWGEPLPQRVSRSDMPAPMPRDTKIHPFG